MSVLLIIDVGMSVYYCAKHQNWLCGTRKVSSLINSNND